MHDLEQRFCDLPIIVDDKIKVISRRDSLKFFNIQRSPNESYDTYTERDTYIFVISA